MRAWIILSVLLLAGCAQTADLDAEPQARTAPPVDTADRPVDAALSQSGRWLAPFDGEVPAINMVVLHDGRILYWSGVEAHDDDGPSDQTFFTTYPQAGESRILEFTADGPVVSTPEMKFGGGDDLFCSGQTILPDGRVLTAGGSHWHDESSLDMFLDGIEDARIFDPATDTWSQVADMDLGRWYPSVFTSPDGDAVAASGIGNLPTFTEHWANWESYDEPSDDWSILSGTDGNLLPLYPRLHLLPGGDMAGEVLYSTAGTLWGPFGEHPQQPEWSYLQSYDLESDTWTSHGLSQFGSRQYASSVMLPTSPKDGHAPTIVSFGGTLQQGTAALPLTEIIDASTDPPTTRRGPDMATGRWNHNSVILPTGEVVTIGGGLYDNVVAHGQRNIPVMEAAMFDPETESWRDLAAMSVERMYHSSAVLLPDGRILTGGHVPLPMPDQTMRDTAWPQIAETRLEVYEPGYLFRGERPVIESAPVDIGYGESFTVDVAFNGTIDSVMLMRPGATTHAYDSNQRATYLEVVEDTGDQLVLRAPPDAVVSQPGKHMLFVNGAHPDGAVPSVAAWVDLA